MRRVSEIIRDGDDFLVAAHFSPDGDAIGSTCAMGHILARLGKRFRLYNPSGLPAAYDFAPLPAPIETALPATMPAWTIVLDCGAAERMGQELLDRRGETRILNIDHHLGNDGFGDENWVAVDQPAVGSMVAMLARELGLSLDGPLAECVYLAVSTDTGFFTYGSTTPESLELAAEMLRGGLDLARMNMLINKQWTEARLRLWAEVMDGVALFADRQVAVGVITRAMFERTGTDAQDTENLINTIRLKTVRVAVTLREESPDTYKFSLRSYGDDNVQAIAAGFGGGGHRNAAGGSISASLDEARAQLVEAITRSLELA
jgi:phosphoesterase RecJ-like protein